MTKRFSSRTVDLQEDRSAKAWDTQQKAVEMVEAGKEVIFLTVGDPDFATPPQIAAQAADALSRGRTRYSPVAGEPKLREAAADWESRRLRMPIAPSSITVFPGAQNALYNVMQCLVEPGDSVLMADPFYATYPGVIAASGADARVVTTEAERGFVIDPDRVRQTLDESTKVLLINSPANPSGCVLEPSLLAELRALCFEEELWLVSDEVYSQFTYDGEAQSVAEPGIDMSRVIIINSVSKTLAMTGWRIGWAITPGDLAQHLENLLTVQLFGVPQFTQDAVAWALGKDQPEVEQMRRTYKERCDCVIEALKDCPQVSCVRPAGGMFVMADVSGVSQDSSRFAFELLESENVAVVPGFGFGESTQSCIRISLTQSVEVLQDACARICRFAKARSHGICHTKTA